ncbi:sporulation integral membrane protein YlbJ [Salirhabdus sp. Marseille-P4669]|uniref:sporulation integral membrane protein YlbJ n=1 Tax=Salirhabdus sp. Marseille-P4669 TaxID=2042310 RepID=UPI000C7A5C0C|nr:sporulation integral membrane protein YlbJ [Salirhabdus sp. Marseille-P4669]
MKSKLKSILLATGAVLLTAILFQFPKEALDASIRGLDLWWKVVFPSLLPFFIISELLIAFGVVKFFGVLTEPVMRPLFNVPGSGSFVWAMGMASGYPSGAKLTARLRQDEQLTKTEAERLVAFTNASNPLFIIAAISVGFFHDEKLGILLAVCHYVGNFFVGICMRFYRIKDVNPHMKKSKLSIKRAFRELHATRIKDERPFGKVFGDAVVNSLQTLLMVGGFIIIFSVINQLLYLVHFTPYIAQFLQYLFALFGLPESLTLPFISGIFEITNGAQLTSETNTNLLQQIVIISFILGFNGLSIQAQVASILAETDIRFFPYFIGRLLHGTFASILAILLYKPLYLNNKTESTSNIPVGNTPDHHSTWSEILQSLSNYGPIFTLTFLSLGVLILTRRIQRE